MKKLHRIACLIVTLCLLLCMVGGCAAPTAPDSTPKPDSSSVATSAPQEEQEEKEETDEEPEPTPAPEEPTQPENAPVNLLAGQLHLWDAAQLTIDTLSHFDRNGFGYYFTLTDRYLYVMGNSLQGTPVDPIPCMLQITMADSSIAQVPLPTLKSEDSYFTGFDVDADGNLHLLETESVHHGEGEYSFSYLLHTVAPDGSVLASHALDLATDVFVRQNAVVCLSDGSRALFTSQKGLLLVSPQGDCRSVSIKAAWNRIRSISMAGDLLLVLYTGSDNWIDQLLLWDTAAGRELRTLTLPKELTTVGGQLEGRLPPTVFGDENGGIWLHNEDGLYAIDDHTGKGTLLCSWSNSDITYSQLNELICAVGNGSFVGIGNGGAEKGLVITALTPRSPVDTTHTTTSAADAIQEQSTAYPADNS